MPRKSWAIVKQPTMKAMFQKAEYCFILQPDCLNFEIELDSLS